MVFALVWLGCDRVPEGNDPPDNDPESGTDTFRNCVSGAVPQGLPTVDWNNLSNILITEGTPWHSAQDVVAVVDEPGIIAGKFSYGSVSKDLQGERIEVYLDDCDGGYRLLGEHISDSDGRISLDLSADEIPAAGEYGLYLRVMGDNTDARARMRVYPKNTQLIVFDIDATLTTSDSELVGQLIAEILRDESTPEARVDSNTITDLRHREQGYELVYLTGRPYLLDGLTRRWLEDLDYPTGTIHLTDEVSHSWPSNGAVGNYKADFLRQLTDAGLTIYAAYGNATSDIYAYEQAGIPKERTYILGEHGGESDTIALGDLYTDHLPEAQSQPDAQQPFRR